VERDATLGAEALRGDQPSGAIEPGGGPAGIRRHGRLLTLQPPDAFRDRTVLVRPELVEGPAHEGVAVDGVGDCLADRGVGQAGSRLIEEEIDEPEGEDIAGDGPMPLHQLRLLGRGGGQDRLHRTGRKGLRRRREGGHRLDLDPAEAGCHRGVGIGTQGEDAGSLRLHLIRSRGGQW
jgi:hypothetical protein